LDFFQPAKIVILDMLDENDDKQIEEILGGPIDGHAGNTEISNMMVIDEATVKLPKKDDKKFFIQDAFETDNIAEKSSNGIADNHPEWVVNKEIGQKSLDLYVARMLKNLETYLQS
jgi:creatinine amidohydrolase/Fe(II)-dependent formamide hydrolase-like protein